MIHFFVTRDHRYTIEQYLQTWGRDLRDRVAPPLYYDQLPFRPQLDPGVYIFSDLERLTPAQTELAVSVYRQLAARPTAFKLLNNPTDVLGRHDLLRALHSQGINRFTARKVDDTSTTLKFPIFLRNESDHKGAISPLLKDAAEVDLAIADAIAQGQNRDQLLLVEFLETKDSAGIYRKYSYFRVGDRFIPRHIAHSSQWVVKYVKIIEPAFVEEELAFLNANPHAEEIRKIFDIARVDYGRIDYAVVDGKCQAFEINTNPTILVTPGRIAISRLHAQGMFSKQFAEALTAIDFQPTNEVPLKVEVSRELSRKLGISVADRALRPLARAMRWLANRKFVNRLA